MHIAMLLSNSFRPDPRVFKEAQSLVNIGYDVTILCWDRLAELQSEERLSSGLKIIRIQNIRSTYAIGTKQIKPLILFWFAVRKQLAELYPDGIHCHDFDTLPIGLAWGKLHRIPVIYDAHEYYADLVKPRLKGFLGKILYKIIVTAESLCAKKADAIITVDEILANTYRHHNKNILILGHYPPKSFAEHKNQIFSRPILTLMYSGRISIDRGALIYIDILKHLLASNIPSNLLFIGAITPLTDEKIINQHSIGLENFINFLGWIQYDQMQNIYQAADVGLSILHPIPRYISAVPVKLFEYMAFGLPVVASNFPSISTIVGQVNCGILVDPNTDSHKIACSIESWWKNSSIPRSLGENGRQAILTKYNWENQIGGLSSLYRNLISE